MLSSLNILQFYLESKKLLDFLKKLQLKKSDEN